MKTNSVAVRSVTIAAAAALSIGVSAPIMPANAQAGVVRTDGNVRVSDSTIDTAATGTLTIFKRANPATTQAPTGEVVDPVPGDALAGAGFTLYEVTNADLTTNDGLAAASQLTVATATQGAAVGEEKTTGTNGQAKWENLPVGVYLLKETTTPEGYSPAADSLVFVPMTRENATNGGTQWLYDITAYPKNTSQKEPQKTVTDSGQNVGDTVTYNIDTYAQTVREGQFRTFYRVEDTLDPALRLAGNNPVTVTSNPNRAFVEGTDYNIRTDWVDAAGNRVDATAEGARQRVRVNFTESGIAKIQNDDRISVEINAEVNSKPGEGDLFNQATQYQNNPNDSQAYEPDTDTPPGEGTPTNEVHTFYGDLEFTKVNSAGDNLKGAVFEVYGVNSSEDQTCANTAISDANRQTASGASSWTSNADGTVTITGLHANNIANFNMSRDEDGNVTTTETPNEWTSYCLVETQSPAGYELLAQPIEFTITASKNDNDEWTVANGSVKVGDNDDEIVNLEDSTPNLPLTGGAGIGILAALGALIIAAGAYSAKRRSA